MQKFGRGMMSILALTVALTGGLAGCLPPSAYPGSCLTQPSSDPAAVHVDIPAAVVGNISYRWMCNLPKTLVETVLEVQHGNTWTAKAEHKDSPSANSSVGPFTLSAGWTPANWRIVFIVVNGDFNPVTVAPGYMVWNLT